MLLWHILPGAAGQVLSAKGTSQHKAVLHSSDIYNGVVVHICAFPAHGSCLYLELQSFKGNGERQLFETSFLGTIR